MLVAFEMWCWRKMLKIIRTVNEKRYRCVGRKMDIYENHLNNDKYNDNNE